MKSLVQISLLSVALMISTVASAGNDPESLRKQVIESVKYPSHLVPQNDVEIVLVTYTIQVEGNLTVTSTNSSNPAFLAYVTEKLNSLRLDGVEREEVQSVKFTFVRQ